MDMNYNRKKLYEHIENFIQNHTTNIVSFRDNDNHKQSTSKKKKQKASIKVNFGLHFSLVFH